MDIKAEERWLVHMTVQLFNLNPGLASVGASLDGDTRRVLMHAHVAATRQSQEQVDTQHMLVGILDAGENSAVLVLHNLGVEPPQMREALAKIDPRALPPHEATEGPLTQLATKSLSLASEEPMFANYPYGITPAHLLLGLWRIGDSVAGSALTSLGSPNYEKARRETIRVTNAAL